MENINLKTLAAQLHLSTATVSKALRDSHEISDETKQRVRALAAALNYIPNPYASSLRKKSSKTIAVVIPEVADSFFAEAINGIEAVAQSKGYHVLIYLTHESFEKEKAILMDFQSGRVDGVLLSVSAETVNTNHILTLQSHQIPIVVFDRICDEIKTAKVSTDDYNSGYKAAQHLIDRGYKKIAYLSISKTLSISRKRMNGYMQAMKENNFLPAEFYICECTTDDEYNNAVIENLLNNENRPDGIIASVEKLTTSVYSACRRLQLKIPEDVGVISFSNLKTAAILNPSLTTITQPAFDIGNAAASLLFKSFEKKSFQLDAESQSFPSVLHIRNST
ncbi:LacI family transcription regulator [Tannerella sp. oral taxon BU063 isolate Cell 6/7/9]|uniref:LacI family transcription regulator n=1 Tax=Tannerella sp. oral taxon BU063 isolate Cell 6/7/9 TaxID=1411021 RepID=W2CVK5_9BACT|nr:LacI family transcription regulator [Tannerella sp. oral taxon BU063 isolate Cell 6/7/9]